MGDTTTPFQSHVQRVARAAEDFIRDRKTGVACEYVHHPEGVDWQAVLIVKVDTSGCCVNDEDNKEIRLCWQCATAGRTAAYNDGYQCRCGSENSVHESKELTFVGEIQISAEAERAAQNA